MTSPDRYIVAAPHQGVPGQMAVKSCNNKIIYKDILTARADATNELSMPCHEQRTGAATADRPLSNECIWSGAI